MAANMYRVGDCVFFETSSTSPFQIRRIEELNKTQNGNVEAKVMCFYRRRELPSVLVSLADKHQSESGLLGALEEEIGGDRDSANTLKQKHQLKHRELFLSRQVETLPATHIRGKCSVTLLNETESLLSYLNKDDTFFYSLVFDPQQKTLLADRGEIRVGSRYQAEPQPLLTEGENDGRNIDELETLVWTPNHGLTDRQIDQFLVISRSVGTFARALDCSSSVKQPSLHMSAAAASRDVTLFQAMDTLHQHSYDLAPALSALVPSTGPILCRDEMEEWSASEANLFEEALEKYGKDFNDIRQDFLPWKTLKNVIEYYYMWKTTDRYVQQKRVKAVEAESKLKQVYIPNYNKPNSANLTCGKGVLNGGTTESAAAAAAAAPVTSGKACESCAITMSSQWYSWGPANSQCRLCHSCWTYWKKYGGLKAPSRFGDGDYLEMKKKPGSLSDEGEDTTAANNPITERVPGALTSHRPHRCSISGCSKEFKLRTQLVRHYATAHGLAMRSGSPRPLMKTRTAFYLHTTPLTRLARRLCCNLLQPRHATRSPFSPVNIPAIKQECQQQLNGKSPSDLKIMLKPQRRYRGKVSDISTRLGQPERTTPQWLLPTDSSLLPKQDKISFPPPPRGPDGSLMYERVPNREEKIAITTPIINNVSPCLLKRRAYEELNGGPEAKIEPEWEEPGWEAEPTGRRGKAPPVKRPASWDIVSGLGDLNSGPRCSNLAMGGMPMSSLGRPMLNHLNGKSKLTSGSRYGGRKQVISWMDAPDDVYFQATEATKKIRRQMTSSELRRTARKPWRRLTGSDAVVILE